MGVKFIEYNGKEILYIDHRGAKNDIELLQILHKGIEIEKTLKENSLALANFENTFLSYQVMEEMKKSGKHRKKVMKKLALVGISGMKVIFLRAYIEFTGQKNIKTFNTEEEAFDWLVS